MAFAVTLSLTVNHVGPRRHYAFMATAIPVLGSQHRYSYFRKADRFMEEAYDDAFEYDWTLRGAMTFPETKATWSLRHTFPLWGLSVDPKVFTNDIATRGCCKDTNKGGVRLQTQSLGSKSYAPEFNAACIPVRRYFQHAVEVMIEQCQDCVKRGWIEDVRKSTTSLLWMIYKQIHRAARTRLDIFDLLNALRRPILAGRLRQQLYRIQREASERT